MRSENVPFFIPVKLWLSVFRPAPDLLPQFVSCSSQKEHILYCRGIIFKTKTHLALFLKCECLHCIIQVCIFWGGISENKDLWQRWTVGESQLETERKVWRFLPRCASPLQFRPPLHLINSLQCMKLPEQQRNTSRVRLLLPEPAGSPCAAWTGLGHRSHTLVPPLQSTIHQTAVRMH